MSTAIIKRDEFGELTEIIQLGEIFKQSGYFRDVRDQAQAVVKILYGRELGFSPVVSMMGIHVIEGKPALSSNLMGAMVKRSGKYDYQVKTLTDKECVLEFTETGRTVGISVFSIDDAQRAGVIRQGSGWTKYPRNMLFARALSNGVKLFCPELSACPIYVPEELGAEVSEEGNVIDLPKSAKPVPVTTEPITFTRNKESATRLLSELGIQWPQDKHGASEGADTHSTEAATPATTLEGGAALPATSVESEEKINVNQQKNFHRECRTAVKPARSFDADNLIYAWLADHGYKDKDGLPSASMIPAAGWLEVRERCKDWLKKQ